MSIFGKIKNRVDSALHSQHDPIRKEIPPPKHKLSRASSMSPPLSTDFGQWNIEPPKTPQRSQRPSFHENENTLRLPSPKEEFNAGTEENKEQVDGVTKQVSEIKIYQPLDNQNEQVSKLEEEKLNANPSVLNEKESLQKNCEELVKQSNNEKMVIEQLETRLKILEAEKETVEKVKKSIQVKLEEVEGLKMKLSEKNRKIMELETSLQAEQRNNSVNMEKLSNLEQLIENLKIELRSKNSKIEELEYENSTLTSFIETQQKFTDTLRLRCIEMETATTGSSTEKKTTDDFPKEFGGKDSPKEFVGKDSPNEFVGKESPKQFISELENIIENLRKEISRHENEKTELKIRYVELMEQFKENERLREEVQLNWGISKKGNAELESRLEEEIKSKKEIQVKLEEAEKLNTEFSAKLEKEKETHKALSEKLSLEYFKNTIPGQVDTTSEYIDQIRQLNNEKQNLINDLRTAQAYSRQLEEQRIRMSDEKGFWWWNSMLFLVAVLVLFFQWIV